MTSLCQWRGYEGTAELLVWIIGYQETTRDKSEEGLAKNYSTLARILYNMHNLEAQKSEQHALEIKVRLFKEEHPSTANSCHSLGDTQRAQGDL